jgi:large subunit ribosomal protein L25
MAEITLVAETGRVTGSRESNRLRGQGRIPAVVYGHGMVPVSIAVDRRELRHALSTPAGTNAVIDLQIGADTHPTVVKQLQRDPVRRSVTHVDFQVVSLTEEISVDVPIHLEGEARGVLSNDGLVEQSLNLLTVTTTPRSIPDNITYDVTDLQIGDVIRVGDLTLPAGVTTDADPDTPVVAGVFVQVEMPEEAAPEGEEAEGAEGAEAAEGGAPAEGNAGE